MCIYNIIYYNIHIYIYVILYIHIYIYTDPIHYPGPLEGRLGIAVERVHGIDPAVRDAAHGAIHGANALMRRSGDAVAGLLGILTVVHFNVYIYIYLYIMCIYIYVYVSGGTSLCT